MTAFLKRIAFALGLRHESTPEPTDDRLEYFHDFGPNVPVEDLGGKPCFYENGQPVYWEKAP